MARRTLRERNVRTLYKVSGGKSYAITVPIEYIRNLGWRERQKLVVSLKGKKLMVEDWKK